MSAFGAVQAGAGVRFLVLVLSWRCPDAIAVQAASRLSGLVASAVQSRV